MGETQKPDNVQNASAAPQGNIKAELSKEKFMPKPDSNMETGCSRAEMLERFMVSKRDSCAEKIREAYPDAAKGRDYGDWHYFLDNEKLLGDDRANEFLAWQNLLERLYWRGFKHANELLEKNKTYFSEGEKKDIVGIMVSQIMKGGMVASPVPLYSDIWRLLERNEDSYGNHRTSHFADYVTDEHRRNALNTGFWELLKATKDPAKCRNACQELSIMLRYNKFYKFFDFDEGARQAEQVPDNLDFERFNLIDSYIRWYLVQEIEISRAFEEHRELVPEVAGKLIAPIVHRLMLSNESDEHEFKKLISFFVKGEIIRSKAMQYQLGRAFEYYLEIGFENSDNFVYNYFRVCESTIIDIKPHISKVWEKVKDGIDLRRVPQELKRYIPKETGESYIKGLKEKMMAMKKFDSKLFEEWMGLKIDEDVPKSAHGFVRNKAFEAYFSQRPRPNGDLLLIIHKYGQNHISNKLDAFLVMDLLLRKRWSIANEILMGYDDATGKERHMFYQGLDEYVKAHGTVQLDKEGLIPSACYPSYNKIVDFRSTFPKLFKEPQKPNQKTTA